MKIIIYILLFTNIAIANDFKVYQKAVNLYQKGEYFTSLHTISALYKYKTPDRNIQSFIEKVIMKTGTYYFNTYTDIELRKLNIPTTDLLMAKRNLYLGKYYHGHKRLKRFPTGHRLYAESRLVDASLYYREGKIEKAISSYQECADAAESKLSGNKDKIFEYYYVLKDTCTSNIARIYYGKQDYKKAIETYELVSKRSFKWPYLIIEQAWAYFYLGKYNRSLGMLMTYKSPLLESYFMPEAEYLKALNYFKLCRYPEAKIVIDNFFKNYHPKSETLRSIISQKNKRQFAYYDLMFTPIKESEKSHSFLRNIVTQISKRVKFQLDLKSLVAINKELERGNKSANEKLLLSLKKDLKEQMNHYTKVSIHQFINDIHLVADKMINLKLESLSQQRILAYKKLRKSNNKKKDNKKMSYKIDREENQDYWKFTKEFWADELAEYVFTLQSMCIKRGSRS